MFQQYVAIINLLRSRAIIHLAPPDDRKMPQRVSKTLTQHPLVLLDQQLKRPGQGERGCHHFKTTATWLTLKGQVFRCDAGSAESTLRAERAIDMKRGVSILLYA